MAALLLWYLGAALFLVFNAVAVIKWLIRGQPVLKAVIGCVLPSAVVYTFMALRRSTAGSPKALTRPI